MPGRGGDSHAAVRERARACAGRDLERVRGVRAISRHRLDARAVPFVRPARDRLGRLPLPGVPVNGRRGRDGSRVFAQSATIRPSSRCAKAPARSNSSPAARDRSRPWIGRRRRRAAMELRVRELHGGSQGRSAATNPIGLRRERRRPAMAADQLLARHRRADRSVPAAAAAPAPRNADRGNALHRCQRRPSRRIGRAAAARRSPLHPAVVARRAGDRRHATGVRAVRARAASLVGRPARHAVRRLRCGRCGRQRPQRARHPGRRNDAGIRRAPICSRRRGRLRDRRTRRRASAFSSRPSSARSTTSSAPRSSRRTSRCWTERFTTTTSCSRRARSTSGRERWGTFQSAVPTVRWRGCGAFERA